jgi:transposase
VTSAIALRYGLHRNQLYDWRREIRLAAVSNASVPAFDFVPVVAEHCVGCSTTAIEIEIGGAIVHVNRALRIPGEVARESRMMSPTIPI